MKNEFERMWPACDENLSTGPDLNPAPLKSETGCTAVSWTSKLISELFQHARTRKMIPWAPLRKADNLCPISSETVLTSRLRQMLGNSWKRCSKGGVLQTESWNFMDKGLFHIYTNLKGKIVWN